MRFFTPKLLGRRPGTEIAWLLMLIGFCLLSKNGSAQNAIAGPDFSTGWGNACADNSGFTYFAINANNSYSSAALTPNGTGNRYWRFGVDGSGSLKQLTISPGTDVFVVPNTTYTLSQTCTGNGAIYTNVSSTTNRYIFKTLDAGTNPTGKFVFFELSGNPATVSSVSQSPVSTAVPASQNVTVTATLSGALPTGQGVYLRYSTNGYATSTVVQMSGSATTYTAIIPAATNTAGMSVSYYVFTSGTANVAADGSNADFYTINLNNDAGSNYSYTPVSIIYQHNFGTTSIPLQSTYSATPSIIDPGLNSSVWTTSGGNFTDNAGSTGQALSLTTVNGTQTLTLTFNVTAGYRFTATSFNYWRQRSSTGPTTISAITINNIPVLPATDNIPLSGVGLGTKNVANPVTNLTGTITVVLTLTGGTGGTFRLDDFTLNGYVTAPSQTAPSISFFSVSPNTGNSTSGYVGSTITVTGSGFLGTNSVRINGVSGTNISVVNDNTITFSAPNRGGQISIQNAVSNATSTGSYTNNGYITAQAGDYATASTWLGGNLPVAGSVTVAHNVTVSTAIANAVSTLTVANSASLTFSTSGSLTATTVLNKAGSTIAWNPGAIGSTLTIADGGTLGNDGTFTAPAGEVNFAGSATVSGANTITFNNVTINAGTVSWVVARIAGTLKINGGNLPTAPTYQAGSTLQYNTSYTRSNEWSAAGIGTLGSTAGYPNNVIVSQGTFTLVNGDAGTKRALASTLTVNAGATFTTGNINANIEAGSVNIASGGTLTLAGTSNPLYIANGVTNAGTLTLSTTAGGDLYFRAGSFTNTGTFTHNNRLVTFAGGSPVVQGFGSTGNSATNCFDRLLISNGVNVTLAGPTVVNTVINLSAGKITLGANNLRLNTAANSISNAGSSNYIVTNGTGQLLLPVGSSQVTFPVGSASGYNPLLLKNTGTADTYGVAVADGDVPAAADPAKAVKKIWSLTETVSGGSNLSVVAQYNAGETGAVYNATGPVYMGLYNAGNWYLNNATDVSGTVTSASNFTNSLPTSGTASYFAIGNANSLALAPAITSMSPASKLAGEAAFTLTVNGSNFTSLSVINWGGTPLATTFVGSSVLTATVPASYIASTGTVTISVTTAGLPNATNPQAFTISQSAAPIVFTNSSATAITATSATLGGSVTALGNPALTENGIVYALTATDPAPTVNSAGSTKLPTTTATTVPATISATPTALLPNQQYSFRAYATNSSGTEYGGTTGVAFYTLANTPAAPAISGATSTTLNVTVNENGNPSNTEYAIQETGGKYLQADGSLGTTAVWLTAASWGTKTITGLTSSTTYAFTVKARNGSGVETAFGPTTYGTTLSCAPPTSLVVSNITNSGAAISWTGTASDYEYQVATSSTPPASGTAMTGTSEFATGLNPSTNYYLHVRSKCGANYSAWATSDPFTTLDPPTGLITWVPSGQSNFGTNPLAPTTADSRIIVGALTRGSAVSTGTAVQAAANAWGGYGWQSNANQEVSFTITPKAGYQLSLSSLQVSYRRSATGPSAADLRYSLDNGTTYTTLTTVDLQSNTVGFTLPAVSLGSLPAIQSGTVIRFQLVPKGGDATGTWYIYNQGLVVNGNVTPVVTEPVATAASAVGSGCFTANWNTVTGATLYYLYVSKLANNGMAADSTLLAGWDFTVNEKSNLGISSNLNVPITVMGANPAVVQSNATIRADGWDNGSNTKSWEISFSTANYLGIRISSTQRSSNAGPKDFKLQYKIGSGGTYADVPGGTVTVANDYTTGVLKLLSLPTACEDKAQVYLRWIMTSNTAAVGGGNVSSNGASNINDIKIFGYAKMGSTYLPGYEKKDVGTATSVQMTGLEPNTTYYYQVKSVVSGVTSNPSNKITVVTTDYSTADYQTAQSGAWSAVGTWQYQSCSGTWIPATAPPGPNNNVYIQNGHTVTLDANVTIGSGKSLTVNSGGGLTTSAYTVGGAGAFTLAAGGTLSIGSPAGISASATSGNIQVTGIRTYSQGGTYSYTGTANQVTGDGLPSTITGALTIANTGAGGSNTVALTTNTTTVSTLNLNSGFFAAGTGQQLNIADVGIVNGNGGNWTTTAAGGTLYFAGAGTIAGTSALNLYNMAVNTGTVTLTKAPVIKGTLAINGGNLSAGPIYAAGSILQYNTGYNRYNEWSATGAGTVGTTPGYPDNVVINNGAFNVYNGAAGVARALAGNLTINSGASANFNGMDAAFTVGNHLTITGALNMNSMSKPLSVKGNLVYTGQLALSTAPGGDLYLGGNYTNNGSTSNFTPNNRAVFFTGSAAQTIGGTNTLGGFDFPYLVIANTAGGVSTTHSITVSANLSLASGILTPVSPATITVTNTAAAAVSGGASTAFVNGPLSWKLPANLSGTSTYTFPVGKGTTYLPFSLNNPATGATAPVLSVEAFNTGSGGSGNGATLNTVSATEYWQAAVLSGNFTSAGVSLARPSALGGLNAIGLSTTTANGSYSSLAGTVGTTAITNSNTTTSLGYFAFAALVPAPVITSFASNNPSGTQTGYTGSVLTINGSNFTNATAVTINGIAATAFTVVSSTQIKATVGAGLTATGTVAVTTPAGSASLGTFTWLGYITKAAGDWNTATTWLGDNLPPADAVVTVAHAATVNGAIANAPASVTVSNSGAITFGASGNLPVTTSFTNNGTVNMTAGGTFTMSGNSSFTNNTGTAGFIPGLGILLMNGNTSTTSTINGSFNLYNVTTNGGLRFTNNAGINGTLQMNAGSYVNTDAPVYNAGSVLKYNTGGLFHRTSEWGSTAGPGYPYHVQLSGNTTLNAGGNAGANVNVPLNLAGDLTIDAGSNFYMDYSGHNMLLPLKIGGNLLLNGALSASAALGGDIEIGKSWTNMGTFNSQQRRVSFTGLGSQTITKAGAESFDYVTVNKPSGSVVLSSDMTVNKELAFAKGLIVTNSNKLVMASTAPVVGAGAATGWVAGNLRKSISTGSNISQSFEIGGADGYRPVSLTFSNVTSGGAVTASVTQADGPHPQLAASGLDATKTVKRYWNFTNSGIAFTDYAATFNFSAADVQGDPANYVVRSNNGSAWVAPVVGTRTALSTQAGGFMALGSVSIGETAAPPVITQQPVNAKACNNNGSFTVAYTGTPTPLVQWQVSTDNGNSFTSLANNSIYSGVTTTTLTITGATAAMNTFRYRAYVSNINGSDTATAATLFAGNNWLGTTSGDWFTASNWSCALPSATTDAIILGGRPNNPVLAAGTGAVRNLTVNSSALLTVAGSLQIGGGVTGSGAITAGAGTLEFNGTAAQAVPASIFSGAIANLVSNNTAGLTVNGNLAVTDKLTLNKGLLIMSSGSLLTIDDGGTVERVNGDLAAPPAYGAAAGVDVAYTGTTDIAAGASSTPALTPVSGKVRHLTINMGNLTNQLNTSTGTPVALAGDLTLTKGNLALGNNLLVGGHWTQATEGLFSHGSNTVTFNGASAQNMIINNGGGTVPFDELIIDNAAGVSLGSVTNISVQNALTFMRGKIVTGANEVLVGSLATVSGAQQSTGWVAGNMRRRIGTGALTKTFDIGDALNYRPVTIASNNIASAGTLLIAVTQTPKEHIAVDNSGINKAKDVNRYFTLTPGLGFSGAYDVTFNYLASDIDPGASQSTFVVRSYNGASWTHYSSEVNTANATKVSVSNLSSTTDFVIGECLSADAADFSILSAATVCAGAASAVTISSASLPAGNYSVTYSLTGANAATHKTAPVTLAGAGTRTGTFNTIPLTAAGTATITIHDIALSGTLQCPAALSSGNTASVTVKSPSQAPTTINASATTVCAAGPVKLTVTDGSLGTGADWKWYTGSCGGTLVGTGSSITVPVMVTTTFYVRAEGDCGTSACASKTITVTGSTNTWTGITGTDWNTTTNWSCGFVPPDGYDVLIPASPSGGRFPVLSSDVSVGTLSLTAPATVSLNDHALTLGGFSGNGSFTGSKSSSLVINGGTFTLSFTQSTDTVSNALANLTVNGGNITLGNKLAIYQVLDLAGGSLNLAGKPLVLKSNSLGTARVAEIKGTLTGETAVTVERYIPQLNNRKWRLLTAPVIGTSINAAWQEGMTFNNGANNRTGTGTPAAPAPGFGTLITGHGPGTAANANGKGFDFWNLVAMSASSLRTYVGAPAAGNASWAYLDNTTANGAFDQAQAYLIFIRGDRYVSVAGDGVKATTLRATGTLRKGTVYLTLYGSSAQSHTLIGNPYAAPLDFDKFYKANPGLLKRYFWLLNSGLAGQYGAYQLVYGFADGTYQALPSPFDSADPSAGNTSDGVIHSGSGFLVVPNVALTQVNALKIEENQKSSQRPGVNVFRAVGRETKLPRFYVNFSEAAQGAKLLLDGAMATWANDGTKTDDVEKTVNSGENLSLPKGGRDLIVAGTPALRAGDTLHLRVWNTAAQKAYLLETKAVNLAATGLTAFLVDRYTNTQTPLAMTGSITSYSFVITADPAAKAENRFYIVFRSAIALPLVLAGLHAYEDNGEARLDWRVEDETGIAAYELEKSADGRSFNNLRAVTARSGSGAQAYTAIDPEPFATTWYRVKMIGVNGEVKYSAIAKLVLQSAGSITISPNPVSGSTVQLHFRNKPAGLYTATLYNAIGQRLVQKQFGHAGGSSVETIPMDKRLASGWYTLKIQSGGGVAETLTLQVLR